jgi:hypothetical protein
MFHKPQAGLEDIEDMLAAVAKSYRICIPNVRVSTRPSTASA